MTVAWIATVRPSCHRSARAAANYSTNQRISDLNTTVSALGDRIDGQFREAAEERRDEHGQIIDRVERLEDLHLKPTEPAQR